jgi:hypothetical protein
MHVYEAEPFKQGWRKYCTTGPIAPRQFSPGKINIIVNIWIKGEIQRKNSNK